ncbi:hypothetical protein OQA88_2741 [Cercophora sp. LCS_1]
MGGKRAAASRRSDRESNADSVASPVPKKVRTSQNRSAHWSPGLHAQKESPAVRPTEHSSPKDAPSQIAQSFSLPIANGQPPFAYIRNMTGSQLVANAPLGQPPNHAPLKNKRRLSIIGAGQTVESWPAVEVDGDGDTEIAEAEPLPSPPRFPLMPGAIQQPYDEAGLDPFGPSKARSIMPAPMELEHMPEPLSEHIAALPVQSIQPGPSIPYDLAPPPLSPSQSVWGRPAMSGGNSRMALTVSANGSPTRGPQEQEEGAPWRQTKRRPVFVSKKAGKKLPSGYVTFEDESPQLSSDQNAGIYGLRPRVAADYSMNVDEEEEDADYDMEDDTPFTLLPTEAVPGPAATTKVDILPDTLPNPQSTPPTGIRIPSSPSTSSSGPLSQLPFSGCDDNCLNFANMSISGNPTLGNLYPDAAEMFQSAFDETVGVPRFKTTRPRPGSFGFFERLPSTHGLPGCSSRLEVNYGSEFPILASQVDSPRNPFKTDKRFRDWLTNRILKMMYVSGETGEPSVETTGIIEDIVRQQVVEILRSCTEMAARRGSRAITINDLIFQIRDDAPKVSRLRTFLSWKDVRKNVKDSDEKGGDADLGAGEDPVGGVVPGGPVDDTAKKNKKAKVGLPWEPLSFYSVEVPEREDEEDDEEEEMNHITLQRLRKADERTKAMTREEYVTWSEYRQASFTYRKGKRFREWAGFGLVTDSKPSDDIVDILGFLTFEMVQTLTEEALKIKEHEDLLKERTGDSGKKQRKLTQGLFDPPSEGRTPVEPRHIQEAFRRLQQRPKKHRAMLNGTRLQQHTTLRLF